jgi:hypothetical protein
MPAAGHGYGDIPHPDFGGALGSIPNAADRVAVVNYN